MNIIETFNRGSTPQYRPPPPTVISHDHVPHLTDSKSLSSSPALDPPLRRSCKYAFANVAIDLPGSRHIPAPATDQSCAATSSANTLIGVGCPHAPPSCANLHSARRSRRHRLPFPAGSFIEGFRTPATVQAASLRSAGIRNPQHERKCRMCCRSGNVARRCARQ